MAGGFFLPPRIRSTASDRFRFHRHRAANIGEVSTACRTTLLDRPGGQELRHPLQREAVLRPERQQDRVVAGRGLQLEVERDAEPLAQRQPERPVEPGAERGVPDQLHARRPRRRTVPARWCPCRQHPELRQPGAPGRPRSSPRPRRPIPHSACEPAAASAGAGPGGRAARRTAVRMRADLLGQLARAARRLAEPERDRRRRAVGVSTRTMPGSTRRIRHEVRAEQEHVAGHGLDRPVLVDGADQGVVRLGQHPVVAQLRDGPAGGERGQPGAAAAAQPPGHPVPVQVGGPAAAAGPDPLGDQLGDLVEVLGGQVRERGRPPDQGQQVVLGPVRRRALGHHLLGQDVQRAGRDHAARRAGRTAPRAAAPRTPPARRGTSGTAARPGCRSRVWLDRPTRCRNVAKLRGEPIWQTSSTGPMSMPSSRDAVATRARRSPLRSRDSTRCRRSLDRLPWCAATWSSPSRSPSWWATRSAIRRVFTNTSVVRCSGTCPAIRSRISSICSAGRDRAELVVGQLEGQVEVAAVPGVHDRAARRPVRCRPVRARADQQPGDGLDRPLGRRQADPLHRPARPGAPAAPGSAPGASRACCPPPRGSRRRSPCATGRQHRPGPLRGDQQVQRLRGGDQEVRRALEHRGPLGRGGVTGPHRHPDVRRGQPELGRGLGDLGQRASPGSARCRRPGPSAATRTRPAGRSAGRRSWRPASCAR